MVRVFKCPNCGGELVFEGGTESLICPHCQQTISVEEIERNLSSANENGLKSESIDSDGDGILEYKCPACGADLVTDEHTAATFCSFCGSPTILSDRISGAVKPKRLIPFAFDKEEAKAHFRNWKGRGLLTPSSFKSEATMSKIAGIYVPYWLYSYHTDVEIHGTAERVRTARHGDIEEISTDHFLINREMKAEYIEVPYDASEKMPDNEMAYLEPFDYTKLVNFKMPYLSGYAAEKFQYTDEDLKDRVKSSIESSLISKAVSSIVGYNSVHPADTRVRFSNEKTEYVMLPVWILNYTYANKKTTLYMNGSTGKINGKLPISRGKTVLLFLGITLLALGLVLLIRGGL